MFINHLPSLKKLHTMHFVGADYFEDWNSGILLRASAQ